MKQRHQVIPAVYLVLIKENKALLSRRFRTGYMDGYYSLPSGHLNGGESLVSALAREAKEEIGIEIEPKNTQLIHVMHRVAAEGDHERIDFYFTTFDWRGDIANLEPHKCDELKWCPTNKLPDNTVPEVRLSLEHIDKGGKYSAYNFD
ncbi:NUDIX hydrolase [soil metagenome]